MQFVKDGKIMLDLDDVVKVNNIQFESLELIILHEHRLMKPVT